MTRGSTSAWLAVGNTETRTITWKLNSGVYNTSLPTSLHKKKMNKNNKQVYELKIKSLNMFSRRIMQYYQWNIKKNINI